MESKQERSQGKRRKKGERKKYNERKAQRGAGKRKWRGGTKTEKRVNSPPTKTRFWHFSTSDWLEIFSMVSWFRFTLGKVH